jgi:ATP phosphoribosyltransferase
MTLLRLAAPSKGRLQEQTAEWFAERGVTLSRVGKNREYAGRVDGIDGMELVYLSAGEIPGALARGEVHLGVTGEDLIRERIPGWKSRVERVAAMGFGRADLIVAAPNCWLDVETVADLDDAAGRFRETHGRPLRVATKYHALAREFFTARGVGDYLLVDSQGATEGAPKNRSAEAIVDITSSGETLRANHLRILADGLILRSEANLWKSEAADWSEEAEAALNALRGKLGG